MDIAHEEFDNDFRADQNNEIGLESLNDNTENEENMISDNMVEKYLANMCAPAYMDGLLSKSDYEELFGNANISMEEAVQCYDNEYLNEYLPCLELPNIVRNSNGEVVEFDMVFNDKKVTVVDSNECVARLDEARLAPVHFDPHLYLGVPRPRTTSIEELLGLDDEQSEIETAELGPSKSEFELEFIK